MSVTRRQFFGEVNSKFADLRRKNGEKIVPPLTGRWYHLVDGAQVFAAADIIDMACLSKFEGLPILAFGGDPAA